MTADLSASPATVAMQRSEDHFAEGTCPNCGSPEVRRHCADCGQRRTSFELSLHDFVHELFHEFMHFDGKILRTLKLLLLSPGRLTREFVEGKRARSISPIRIYLLASLLFFAVVTTFGRFDETLVISERARTPAVADSGSSFDAKLQAGAEKVAADRKAFAGEVMHAMPKVMFVLLPLFAAIVMAFYRRQQKYYIPHLYFAIHLHAFMFLLFSLLTLLDATGLAFLAKGGNLLLIAAPVYFVMALREVYRERWARTALKAVAIGFTYLLVFSSALVVLVAFKLLTA